MDIAATNAQFRTSGNRSPLPSGERKKLRHVE
jgi:hypothetical protein